MAKGFIICGFPGVGKTVAANSSALLVDVESSLYSLNWPYDYVDEIERVISNGITAMVSSSRTVRDELRSRGHNFILMYPTLDSKEAYIDNYLSIDANPVVISDMVANWDKMVQSCMNENPRGISVSVLTPDVYLGDILATDQTSVDEFLVGALEDFERMYD